jgi:hypothetical protein
MWHDIVLHLSYILQLCFVSSLRYLILSQAYTVDDPPLHCYIQAFVYWRTRPPIQEGVSNSNPSEYLL